MKRWLSWSHAWCHTGVLERRKSIASKLTGLAKRGELTMVGNDLVDVASMVEIVRLLKDRRKLGGVAVDPAGLSEFADALEASDLDVTVENKLLFGAPQGYAMMNAIKTCERRIAKGMLLHCGGELMPWCVGNIKIEPMATAIRATKQNAGDAKIDPAMAQFNAATLMATNPQPTREPKFQVLVF
jgi:phage terminase large subunit-like protein